MELSAEVGRLLWLLREAEESLGDAIAQMADNEILFNAMHTTEGQALIELLWKLQAIERHLEERPAAIPKSVERVELSRPGPGMQAPNLGSASSPDTPIVRYGGEHRRAPRIASRQHVKIRFTDDEIVELNAIARNVSTTGMLLDLDRDIAVGTGVELTLSVPREAGRLAMPVRGKVVRLSKTLISGVAVAFEPAGAGCDLSLNGQTTGRWPWRALSPRSRSRRSAQAG